MPKPPAKPRTRPGDRRSGPPQHLDLGELTAFAGWAIESHGDYDHVLFADEDLGQAEAIAAELLACRLERCRLDGLVISKSRLVDTHLRDCGATSLDVTDGQWRNVLVEGGRIGALQAAGGQWASVRIRGVRIDYGALNGARLDDVIFEDCEIGELDLGMGQLKRLAFERCRIGVLDLEFGFCEEVNLAGAEIGKLRGVGYLRGATVSASQLLDLAPDMARHLGIKVSRTGTGADDDAAGADGATDDATDGALLPERPRNR